MKPHYELNLPKGYDKNNHPMPDKDKWIAALRSGEYKQGQGVLRDADNYYCCLGVLSELQDRLTDINDDVGRRAKFCDGEEADSLSNGTYLSRDNPMVVDVEGFDSQGSFPEGVSVEIASTSEFPGKSLAQCNDWGLNFNQIADIIDQVWS